MNPLFEQNLNQTRRHFFGRTAAGLGTAALATLLGDHTNAHAASRASSPGGLPGLPHFAPRAKRVIYLFMNGAPTHVDLFDYKPKLAEMHGVPMPPEYLAGKRFSTMTGDPNGKVVLAPVEPFHQYGESGAWISDLMPYTAQIADDLCFVKSMHTEAVNHAPAITFFFNGLGDGRSTHLGRVACLWLVEPAAGGHAMGKLPTRLCGILPYGYLLVPKNIAPGERRPVVFCQHGGGGTPANVTRGSEPTYKNFAAQLVERGFVVYAPSSMYNPTIVRMTNSIGKTQYSVIAAQYQQVIDFLKTQPTAAASVSRPIPNSRTSRMHVSLTLGWAKEIRPMSRL